jgi:hypothetical protein
VLSSVLLLSSTLSVVLGSWKTPGQQGAEKQGTLLS